MTLSCANTGSDRSKYKRPLFFKYETVTISFSNLQISTFFFVLFQMTDKVSETNLLSLSVSSIFFPRILELKCAKGVEGSSNIMFFVKRKCYGVRVNQSLGKSLGKYDDLIKTRYLFIVYRLIEN